MTGLLSADRLRLYRGDRCLIRDLSFALNPGELLLVEGANGSGKTSLLRAIAGLLPLDQGEIHWRGKATRLHRQELSAEMSWLAHRLGMKYDLTLVENLRFEARLRGAKWHDQESLLRRLGIDRLTRLPLRALSAGQQRRVALARLILSASGLWLMDEPFTNLDVAGHDLVLELVREHLRDGGLCVVASHQSFDIGAPTRRVTLQ
ncbi:MAG: cytochrome c biogenesis heme-transporting ATPase CcmA [Gammaproteobacteria bacterium]|nr:cytochrome c biogenesis heme-transporting ATPase CcmA [Gammaproteobacteria bacterium]MDH4313696.1 cytochrome c biogenesis heme-transporting ATPase CcmA [Gammaproteobacteria bacterium]MDH5215610.1 cytochrome c biogenesis heme-transporting ATPase CcmA [Gammaproteobacteria bacterium]